jgi:hypothetical protein
MTKALTIVAIGFFLGIRHATDPDHIIAVSTIVSREFDIQSWADRHSMGTGPHPHDSFGRGSNHLVWPSCAATVKQQCLESAERYHAFFAVLDRDARDSLAAIELVLAQLLSALNRSTI